MMGVVKCHSLTQPSFPRKRESSRTLRPLDSRFRGNDEPSVRIARQTIRLSTQVKSMPLKGPQK